MPDFFTLQSKELEIYLLCTFQQFKGAFELLKEAYFNDTSNINAIKRQNIDLLSDMNFAYGILKAAQYQVEVNNKGTPKNTFVLRFICHNLCKQFSYFCKHLIYVAIDSEQILTLIWSAPLVFI